MEIKLYSTHCPQCKVLESKLTQKGVNFIVEDNTQMVIAIGREHKIMGAPILEVDGEFMDFSKAVKWVNGVESTNTECESCKF